MSADNATIVLIDDKQFELQCTVTVLSDKSAGDVIVSWYKDSVLENTRTTTPAYVKSSNKTMSTYTNANATKTDGGAYKCEFTFNDGSKLSKTNNVHIHCELFQIHNR